MLNLNHSFHPWTPRCYRPVKTHTITSITRPKIESPPILLALLEMSKGLPPPESSGLVAGLDVVDEVLVATDPFLELLDVDVDVVVVVGAGPPPSPPPADSIDDVEDVEDVEVVAVVLAEVDCTVTDTTEVECRSELLLSMDCGTGIEVDLTGVDVVVLKPNPPVFPTLLVGIVTTVTAGGAEVAATGVVDDFRTVVVVVAKVGHKAATIPPFFTMPNKVLEFTDTSAHESLTAAAIEFNPDMQAAEQPPLKSDFVHEDI